MSTSATSSPSQSYPLSRSTIAATRLDLQHFLWTSSTESHLHPSIPVPDDALIADVGCGTGIWSLTYPRPKNSAIRFEAMDISLSQVPPTEWLPDHVTARTLDIFAPVPEDLRAKFDVVHVRLFLLVVRDNDPVPILSNLLKLLKPGGYLHWQEYDTSKTSVVVAAAAAPGSDAETAAPAMTALHRLTTGGGRNASADQVFENLSWVSTFARLFERGSGKELGAELVSQNVTTPPSHLLPLAQEIGFLGAREYATGLRPSQPELAARLDGATDAAERECWDGLKRGSAIGMDMMTWVVRKSEK